MSVAGVAKAEGAIQVSALTVAGIYAFRRFTETSGLEELQPYAIAPGDLGFPAPKRRGPGLKGQPQLKPAQAQLVPLGTFIIGWGFLYLSLSVAAVWWPRLARDMALMVLIASLLTNGVQISRDLQGGLKSSAADRTKRGRPRRGARPAPSAGKMPTNEEGTVV